MKKGFWLIVFGFVLGVCASGLFVWKTLPRRMLPVHESRFAFEETVVAISAAAIDQGWRVPKIYDLHANFIIDNYEDITRMKVISLYDTDITYRMIYGDDNKRIAALLPYRIAVYETSDGAVYVSHLNTGILSRFYSGSAGEMMSQAARQEKAIIEHIMR